MPTYLHTYIPKNPTNPTYYYRQTYRLMPTNERIQTYKLERYTPTYTPTYIQNYIPITLTYPTNSIVSYPTPTDLPPLYTTDSFAMKMRKRVCLYSIVSLL